MNNQGKIFNKNRNKYIKLIPDSILTNRGVIEAAQGDMNLKDVLEVEKQELSQLENQFNSTLSQYQTNYKVYLEELMNRQSNGNSNLQNKVVNYNNSKYWINGSGVARKFSSSSWTSKSTTCSNPVSTINANDFNKLTPGPPMGLGEECNSGGFNAVDKGSQSIAWIDEQGYKHIYEDPLDRHSTCRNTKRGDDKEFNSIAFNAIPSGSPYSNTDSCQLTNVDVERWEIIKNLNIKLIRLINKMDEKVKDMNEVDGNINKDIQTTKSKLSQVANELKIEQKKINKLKMDSNSLDTRFNEKYLEIKSINLRRTMWLLAGLTISIAIYRQLK
jgi:hypothetical protein